MSNSFYWLLLLAILIFVEIITVRLTTIWFAAGALVSFIISLFLDNLILEVILFLLVSLLLLYLTKPLLLRYMNPNYRRNNCEEIIGKEAVVLTTIDNMNQTGKVNVDGQEWPAKSYEGNVIEEGSEVKIQGMSGTKLLVRRL
jgi:membrane protein implicated in regulation of membrane protease activity